MLQVRPPLVGLAAGLASALLCLGVGRATTLALPLFLMSPLPIGIAAIGFGTRAAVAAVVGGVAMMALLSLLLNAPEFIAIGFLLSVAAPAATLGHLVMLRRTNPGGDAEWFPLDRLLIAAAGTIFVVVVLTGFILGYDPDEVAKYFEPLIAAAMRGLAEADVKSLARLYATAAPASAAASLALLHIVGLWAAARVTRLSGLLARPWTPAWKVRLPRWAGLLFAGAVVGAATLAPPLQLVAMALVGSSGLTLALVGLASFHERTLGRPTRTAVLTGAYIIIVITLGLSFVLLALLGLADTLLRIRSRRPLTPPPASHP